MGRRKASTTRLERLMAKVRRDPNSGCWLWTGGLNHKGYGRMTGEVPGRWYRAHRVSFELHKGPIPVGMFVCHHCDVPSCVNPDHLFLGTHTDNMRDAARKGRLRAGTGKLHEWDADIRALVSEGFSQGAIAAMYGVTQSSISRRLRA